MTGPIVVFRIEDATSVYLLLFDLGTMTFREIRNHRAGEATELLWMRHGCELFIGRLLIDLRGNTTRALPESIWQTLLFGGGDSIGRVSLALDGEWLAYNVLSGPQTFFAAENIDVGVVPLNDLSRATLLTKYGRGDAMAWSPDGQRLAFSDLDDRGIPQLFVFSRESGAVGQITSHSEPLAAIEYLVWSPDGQRIAYGVKASAYDEGDEGWVAITSLGNSSWCQIEPDDFAGIWLEEMFWSADGARIMFAGHHPHVDDPKAVTIHWADTETGEILRSFFATDAPYGEIGLAFPVESLDKIVLEVYDELYLLDATDMSIGLLTRIEREGFQLIRDASVSPFEFQGEENCWVDR